MGAALCSCTFLGARAARAIIVIIGNYGRTVNAPCVRYSLLFARPSVRTECGDLIRIAELFTIPLSPRFLHVPRSRLPNYFPPCLDSLAWRSCVREDSAASSSPPQSEREGSLAFQNPFFLSHLP